MDLDDDRLDGTVSGRVDIAFCDPENAAMRGTVAITNEDGSWNGTVSGAGLTDIQTRSHVSGAPAIGRWCEDASVRPPSTIVV